ncbi:APC family permease [Arthrobacter sp. SDTb3-6]|uniref:APC family permease n=1 Tax=Arthrobacter sp. SDTb3-6 TaxID=2713571 RepID=UPI00159D8E53|nr:APC family permease [Arthrobacter sp. SDTb3-6]NVN00337.1 APC family permease [Arthrobacter sp. SDTb3-6]
MAALKAPVPSAGARPGLKREIGFIGLLWASTGSIIGSGWLFGAKDALQIAGPAALISWVIGGICILILALPHAELGGMYPVSGGTARFPHYAFGGAVGASFGWFSWVQAATVAPIEVQAIINYAGHYNFAKSWLVIKQTAAGPQPTLTGSGLTVAILLMAFVTAVNFLSIKKLANVNSAATWWKVGVPLLTIFMLAVFNFHPGNFTASNGFDPDGVKGILSAVSTGGIVFALLGFEQADQLAGESSNPKKDIPRAVIGATVIGVIIYLLVQFAFLVALPSSQIGTTWANGVYTAMTGPFADLATLVGFGWLASVLYIDALISPGGTALIYVTASSRVSYGLSRNGYVPVVFEKTNKSGVPWVGLIAAFVIGCICFLPFPTWQSIVGLITSASVLMYAGAPLALGAFRRRLPDEDRPYRLPGANVMSPLAFIVANLLIMWTGWNTDWKLGVAILIGYVILVGNRLFNLNPLKPQMDWKAAQWLPVYLVGMGLIVYVSDFGPLAHPWFPLYWDIVATGVFSLIIYYWAVHVALSTEEIKSMVNTVVVAEEETLTESS